VNVDSPESTITRLTRRPGFVARARARSGLLPGQVSTEALLKARRYRLTAWIGVPAFLVFVFVIVTLSAGFSTSDKPAVVREVRSVEGASSNQGEFEVVLGDGTILLFDRDPNVSAGETVHVRSAGNDAVVGLVVRGVLVPTSYRYDSGLWPVVFGAMYILLAVLIIVPYFVWGRRAHHQIKEDIDAPLATTRGRYVGSWSWRGMSNRLARSLRSRKLGQISGFPVAIDERPDEVTWFVVPVDLLPKMQQFEETILEGTQQVVVTYHPNTHAIAKLEAADGTATLDVQVELDRLSELRRQLTKRPRRRPRELSDF
jgi:hypothetical protein